MQKENLMKLIEDDELGLLDVKPSHSSEITADERLIKSFMEINQFVSNTGREPQSGAGLEESLLYMRLKGIRQNTEKKKALSGLDEHGLLKTQRKNISTIQDILRDDDMGLLSNEADSIFSLKHVSKEKTMPNYIASRKRCSDFHQFEPKLIQCQTDLSLSKRKLLPFKNEQQIKKGYFFVLKGVLLYVAEVGVREKQNGKVNARLRCIFENGTESDMLLRSLAAELYKNGRRVSEHDDHLLDELNSITENDEESGYIYILKSLSKKTEINEIKDLYKIGFSSGSVEDRIKNAEQDPTFLMAQVSIVEKIKCFNMNTQKFEKLLHTFFGSSCLSIDIYDNNGKRHSPREWFIAPLNVIEQAVDLIVSGDIANYHYDSISQKIVQIIENR